MSAESERMAYLGRDEHGCAVAVRVDNPESVRAVARDVADFIRQGLTVERVTVASVRDGTYPLWCAGEREATP